MVDGPARSDRAEQPLLPARANGQQCQFVSETIQPTQGSQHITDGPDLLGASMKGRTRPNWFPPLRRRQRRYHPLECRYAFEARQFWAFVVQHVQLYGEGDGVAEKIGVSGVGCGHGVWSAVFFCGVARPHGDWKRRMRSGLCSS
jgi:hypothetical protein